jgi:Zn-dependent metalloprotease
VHHDGQIWSRALWDIRNDLGASTADRIIIEAQFDFAPDTSFHDAAKGTIATAQELGGNNAANVVRDTFHARGIPGI